MEAYVGTDFGEAARSAFERNPMAQDAVVRNLQVLAESAGRISRDNQLSEPAIAECTRLALGVCMTAPNPTLWWTPFSGQHDPRVL